MLLKLWCFLCWEIFGFWVAFEWGFQGGIGCTLELVGRLRWKGRDKKNWEWEIGERELSIELELGKWWADDYDIHGCMGPECKKLFWSLSQFMRIIFAGFSDCIWCVVDFICQNSKAEIHKQNLRWKLIRIHGDELPLGIKCVQVSR